MIRWITSWEDKGQIPTFHQSATPRSSTGNLLSLSSTFLLLSFTEARSKYSPVLLVWMLFHYTKQLISLPLAPFSKPLKPSTTSNKPLPYIKVIEIKSWSGHAGGGGELLTRGRQNHQTFSMQTENKHRMWRRGYFGRESWASCSNTSTNTCEPQTLLKESVWCFAAHTQTHTHSDACGVSALVSIYKVYWFSRFEVLHVWYCTRAFPRPALFWLLCYPLSLWQWRCCCCQSRTVEQRAGSGSWHYEVCVQQCSKKRRLSWKFDVKIANQMSCVRLLIQDSVHSAEWMTL